MDERKKAMEPGKMRQFLAAIIVNLSAMSYGTMIGWQSPYALELQSPSPPVGSEPMTDDGVSWLTGSMCLSGTFTTALLSVIPDRYSRKLFGCLQAVPLGLSWLLMVFATEYMHIYVARVLGGVGGAGVLFFVPIYVSEISSDSVRGLLGSVLPVSINMGILLAYILGGMISLRDFAIANLTLPVLYLVTFVFLPESPIYLVRQNRIREAMRSLTWLKAGDDLMVERTLSHLQTEVKNAATSAKSAKLLDLFRDKAAIKGLIITLGLFGAQQFCGIMAMINYTETIFEMSGSSLSPNTAAVIVATIQLFGSYLSSSLMERAGRRPLLLISCIGMFVCHCTIGTFCYFQEFKYDVSAYGWVPVIALSVFMITYALGMGTGPIVVMSEIFSRDISSLGTSVCLCFLWIAAFIMVKIFNDLVAFLGMYGCFFFLAASCACSFVFCFVLLPETKGRMREDIVDELNGIPCTKSKKNTRHIIGTCSVQADSV